MLARSFSLFFKNPSLAPQVLSNLVFDYYLLFLPIILFGFFEDHAKIALAYSAIYGLSALLLQSKTATTYLHFYAGVIALSSLIALFQPSLLGYILSGSAFLGLTIRDAQQSVFQLRISDLSEQSGKHESKRIFSVMTVLGMVMLPVFTMGGNISLSFFTEGSTSAALWAQCFLSLILMALLYREPRVTQPSKSSVSGIPTPVRIMCWYSTLFNATSFPLRMIVSPLIIYASIREMGYDAQALSITGAIVGFIAILGILVRFMIPSKAIDNASMMRMHHHGGILTMFGVVGVAYGLSSDWWDPKAMPWVIASVVLLQLGLETFGKLWSIGFIGLMRELTVGSGNHFSVYQASYLHFMSMKNFGSFLGCFLASASYLFFEVPATSLVTGLAGIFLMTYTIDRVRPTITPAL